MIGSETGAWFEPRAAHRGRDDSRLLRRRGPLGALDFVLAEEGLEHHDPSLEGLPQLGVLCLGGLEVVARAQKSLEEAKRYHEGALAAEEKAAPASGPRP